jgi:fibronectin type 3 domain-containing protein
MSTRFLMILLAMMFLLGVETRAESIRLAWDPNPEGTVVGYHVYRSVKSGSEYTRITDQPVSVPYYLDATVSSPGTYYYVTTAVSFTGRESAFSREVTATLGLYDPNPQTAALAVRAIPDSTMEAGQLGVLSGNVWNPENRNLYFTWSQIQGPAVTIVDRTNPDASFVAPFLTEDAVLLFSLTVTDGENTFITDTLQITVHKK